MRAEQTHVNKTEKDIGDIMFNPKKYMCSRIVADMFVIPNKVSKDKIQIWLTNEGTDNLQDHAFFTIHNGEQYLGRIKETVIPYSEKMKEGTSGILNLTFLGKKCVNHLSEEGEWCEFPIKVEVTCNQLDYRYRRFGKFEEAAAYATAC